MPDPMVDDIHEAVATIARYAVRQRDEPGDLARFDEPDSWTVRLVAQFYLVTWRADGELVVGIPLEDVAAMVGILRAWRGDPLPD